jgi:hypothetical protein
VWLDKNIKVLRALGWNKVPARLCIELKYCSHCKTAGHVNIYDDEHGSGWCQTCWHKSKERKRERNRLALRKCAQTQKEKYFRSICLEILKTEEVLRDMKKYKSRCKSGKTTEQKWRKYYETEYPKLEN